jgi:hypothetical protein
MATKKTSGKQLADMLYGKPDGAAFGVYPQAGKRGQAKPTARDQLAQLFSDDRAVPLPQFGDADLSVPTAGNRAMGQRMVERDVDLKRQADRDMSPLEKFAGGLQTGRLMGSGLVQAVKSIPTAVTKGGKAAEEYIAENIYKPTQPKAYEYAQDIGDFLTSLETDYKIPPVLPEALALQYLAGPAKQQAKRGALQAGMKLERGMEPIVQRAMESGGLPREMVMAMGNNTQSNVIKPKDGNWMGKNVEGALKGLKGSTEPRLTHINEQGQAVGPQYGRPMTEEELQALMSNPMYARNQALNKWVDSNLTNYVKKEMATPEDPVRKLAEEGITHFPIAEDPSYWARKGESSRKEAGGNQMATSDLAKQWENRSDAAINVETAQQHQDMMHLAPGMYTSAEDWIKKLPPETTLYNTRGSNFNPSDLGFDHIIDVLREDLTAGRIRPEKLNTVSMEQAVRRTYEYDQELAKKMAEAKATAREGLPVYKEYPEGYRWVELNKPGSFAAESEAMGHSVRGYEPPQGHPDWVEGSGGAGSLGYGHGGWEAIKSGKAKVYSLVDSKGQPHVTVESRAPDARSNYEEMRAIENQADNEADAQGFTNFSDRDRFTSSRVQELKSQLMAQKQPEGDYKITQIKGKSNAAPKEDYLPFVQDFVRSGQWSDVGDLGNTGLIKHDSGKYISKAEMNALSQKHFGESMGNRPDASESPEQYFRRMSRYDPEYLSDVDKAFVEDWRAGNFPSPDEGMAHGGRVHFSDNPDVMQLELAGGGIVRMGVGGAMAKTGTKGGAKAAKEAAVPLTLPRVRPSTQEILEAAERVGKQQAGEFVRSPLLKDTTNLAGRSKREVDRLKSMDYKVTPIKDLPEMKPYEAKVGEVNMAVPGDQTISDMLLESVDGMPIGTTSEGGALFGRGRLADPEETRAFWASNIGPAELFQKKVTDLAQLYNTDMVTAYHLAMGQRSNNFAQHMADASLRAIDYSKLDDAKMGSFDDLMRNGYIDPVSKKRISFPNWPGIAFPEESLQVMKEDPLLRKFFNDRMKTPTVTKPLDLPNAKSIEYAMTEPELRDLEINMTGLSAGRMKPGAELIPDSAHQTYSHDIPGTALGRAPELSPFSISFPDAAAFVRDKYRAQDFTGTIQKVFPHQVVDEAYLDDMYKYYTQLRQVRGFNEGGAVRKYAEGGEITADDLILEERKL